MNKGGRCHPLTILDDHSRYNILLLALANERALLSKIKSSSHKKGLQALVSRGKPRITTQKTKAATHVHNIPHP